LSAVTENSNAVSPWFTDPMVMAWYFDIYSSTVYFPYLYGILDIIGDPTQHRFTIKK